MGCNGGLMQNGGFLNNFFVVLSFPQFQFSIFSVDYLLRSQGYY